MRAQIVAKRDKGGRFQRNRYQVIDLDGQRRFNDLMIGRFTNNRLMARARKWLVPVALGALVVRALIPLGYMPGNALAGEFVVLCPTGLSAEIVQMLHDGHVHHQTAVDMDAECPIGMALKAAALPVPPAADLVSLDRVSFDTPESETPPYRAPFRHKSIRAPPLV